MASDYLLSVGSVSLSKKRKHGPCTLLTAAKHNKRELASDLEERGRIDPDRVHLNYCLAGAVDADGVASMALALMAEIGTAPDKQRRDYCQAIEVLFSLPASTTLDTAGHFKRCVSWCCDQFGAGNLLSADVHLDESHPHCHVLIAPIRGGRWVGSKSLIGIGPYKTLRDSFAAVVAKPYGLKMSEKIGGQRKTDAAAMVLEHIEAHDKALIGSPAWVAIRKSLESDPEPFLACYGLVLGAAPEAKRRSFTQIMTSKGKGPNREPEQRMKSQDFHGVAQRQPVAQKSKDFAGHARDLGQSIVKSYDFENGSSKKQSLSCEDFQISDHQYTPETEPIAGLGRMVEMDTAQPFIDDDGVIHEPVTVMDGDGLMRVRDAEPLPADF
jgi:hypothetical protein